LNSISENLDTETELSWEELQQLIHDDVQTLTLLQEKDEALTKGILSKLQTQQKLDEKSLELRKTLQTKTKFGYTFVKWADVTQANIDNSSNSPAICLSVRNRLNNIISAMIQDEVLASEIERIAFIRCRTKRKRREAVIGIG
jgi:hypothetical protein